MVNIVGRDEHLASIEAFLGDREAPALVVEGEAGIGKSTLWLAGVGRARERGFRILSSSPAEAERGLAFVGLGDLLDDSLEEVLPPLSPPRRRALEAALLLEDATADVVDPRAIGLAVRDAAQALAQKAPLLVAIDDAHWFDAASTAALAFSLRRLGNADVRLFLARRLQPTELEQAVDAGRLRVGPLSLGALHGFLLDRVGRAFARQSLLRIHEQSGGNPFFALEIARVLDAEVDPTRPLPVPQTLDELVRARLTGLPGSTREALALAAAVGAPSESLLERAGVVQDVLRPALDAGVIVREGGTIRFTHPLLASAVYDPSVHGRLADVVDEPLARARHRALSQADPDEDIAGALDDAVRLAGDRGATAVAAELAEHAVRLTPPGDRDSRHRRALAAARAHHAAGQWTRARAIATDVVAETEPGPERANALVFLAGFEIDEGAVPLLQEAMAQADARLQLRIRIQLAFSRRFSSGFAAAFDEARAALAAADELEDDELRVWALSAAAFLGRTTLDPEVPAHAVRAREIAAATGDQNLLQESAGALGQVLVDRGEYEAARASLESDYAEWHERDERFAGQLLWTLAWLELWSGNFARAAECAARSHEISIQYGIEQHAAPLPVAWAAAYCGRLDRAREFAERGLALCADQIYIAGPLFPAVLGIASFWGGDVAAGVAQFAEAERLARAVDWRNPHMRPWTADYVEALLELGRVEEAVRVLSAWEADARALDRPRLLAQVTRCRGLVAVAEGRVNDAASLLEDAVAQHQNVGDAFGRARALLALGVARRRQRQKRAARDAIGDALATFEELGAATWMDKAHGELGRIGGRTREGGLTAAERRVAALVAEGRTNREVAAALFLGERTVETHLSHVYSKLGVRSRAELARTYRPDEQSSGGLPISS